MTVEAGWTWDLRRDGLGAVNVTDASSSGRCENDRSSRRRCASRPRRLAQCGGRRSSSIAVSRRAAGGKRRRSAIAGKAHRYPERKRAIRDAGTTGNPTAWSAREEPSPHSFISGGETGGVPDRYQRRTRLAAVGRSVTAPALIWGLRHAISSPIFTRMSCSETVTPWR